MVIKEMVKTKRRRKNKTVLGVIGVLLTLFGIMGTIPILFNMEYASWLLVTGVSVIVGVILMAWASSD
jgi:uncharacterized membrane protein